MDLRLLSPAVRCCHRSKYQYYSLRSGFISCRRWRNTMTGPDRSTSALQSFYYQSAIEHAASKPSVRLSLATLLYTSRHKNHILQSAQYLQRELPIRMAHRIRDMRELPFVIGCNPTILRVHELYISAFNLLTNTPEVVDYETEREFSQTLQMLLEDHKQVIELLVQGFKESKRHLQKDEEFFSKFLDSMLTARLGMRLLCEHHLQLPIEKTDRVGIVYLDFSPKRLIEYAARDTINQSEMKFGQAPELVIDGHTSVTFAYIPSPLDYILREMLKNAMSLSNLALNEFVDGDRLKWKWIEAWNTNLAVMETHRLTNNTPPITVTISNNSTDFVIRISDLGGGIRHDLVDKVWEYGFTSEICEEVDKNRNVFDLLMDGPGNHSMFGYGIGLPICKAYCQYLGGDLTLQTMHGRGTDVYIRLRHLEGKSECVRI